MFDFRVSHLHNGEVTYADLSIEIGMRYFITFWPEQGQIMAAAIHHLEPMSHTPTCRINVIYRPQCVEENIQIDGEFVDERHSPTNP